MKVWTFPIIVHVPAETEEEATAALFEAGLRDGPATIEQEGRRVEVFYVNVEEGAYGDVHHTYDTEDTLT